MQELIVSLGTTEHRRGLLRNLIAYRALLATDGYSIGLQFINGSFVEDTETKGHTPSDIDVFSILSLPGKYHADPSIWAATGQPFWASEIANTKKNKARYSLDTYAVLLEELLHGQGIGGLIQSVIYWYSLFSHQKNTLAWKGFVAIELNPADDAAALAALGST